MAMAALRTQSAEPAGVTITSVTPVRDQNGEIRYSVMERSLRWEIKQTSSREGCGSLTRSFTVRKRSLSGNRAAS